MTVALHQSGRPQTRRFDISMPLLAVLGLFLCTLVLLPLLWLAWYSVTDEAGALTPANFVKLVRDPSFVSPFLTALAIALSVAVASCAVAMPLAWLVSRTNMPLRGMIRAFVTASFVTPPFLGAIAWEILAAPNSGMLNQWYRALFDLEPDEHLFDIYTVEGVTFAIACYAFPYVFVLVANALDRIPADLEDASAILGGSRSATLRRVILPLVLPALLAGALVVFLQSLTLFGTTPLLCGDRRQERRAAACRSGRLALAGVGAGTCYHRDARPASLCSFAEDGDGAHRVRAADLGELDAAQHPFRLCRVLADPARPAKHVSARLARRDGGYASRSCRQLSDDATPRRRPPGSRLSRHCADGNPWDRARC